MKTLIRSRIMKYFVIYDCRVWDHILLAFLLTLFQAIFLAHLPCYAVNGSSYTKTPLVKIEGRNRSLREIVWEVSQQTGYKIEIGESLLDQKVNGRYADASVDTFFHRILKGRNVFQVVDPEKKIIRIRSTLRKTEQSLVVEAQSYSNNNRNGLDGEKTTFGTLLHARAEVFKNYDPGDHELDGEPGKTTQDLLEARTTAFANYDPDNVELDGNPGKMNGDLRRAQQEVFAKYDPAEHQLDNNTSKSYQDLLDAKALVFAKYDAGKQPLDGQPEITWQELLDAREKVFSKRRR